MVTAFTFKLQLAEQVNKDPGNVHAHARPHTYTELDRKNKRSELREMKGRSSFKVKDRGGVTKQQEEGRGWVHTHQKDRSRVEIYQQIQI